MRFFSSLILTAHAQAIFENPLAKAGITDIPTLVGALIRAGLGLVGVLALVMFMWGGMQWMTSAGNEEKVAQGKGTMLWAVLGLGAIVVSYAAIGHFLGIFGL